MTFHIEGKGRKRGEKLKHIAADVASINSEKAIEKLMRENKLVEFVPSWMHVPAVKTRRGQVVLFRDVRCYIGAGGDFIAVAEARG